MDVFGKISRWTPAENCQYPGFAVLFQPVARSGSIARTGLIPPKFGSAIAPHSPLASGLIRSQSGEKLRLVSFHDRVVDVESRPAGVSPTMMGARIAVSGMYLPRLTCSAVL